MASIEEKTKFISMCSNIIRENYDGNPLTLNSFLDKINLIEDLISPNLNNCFISFIKSKLDGKAREVLPEQITNVDQIKNTLKNRIKPDSSKVVAGRFVALHVKNNNYEDFSKNVEGLADALMRSLVIEGITKEKAEEMAIEQTVDICRKNAKSDMVKAILASSVFKEPKDVVAKLIVEETKVGKDFQVLTTCSSGSFHEHSNRNRRQSHRDNFNNFYGNNSHNNYRGNNNYNNSRGNNNYNKHRNHNNFRGQNNSRGRGYNNRGRYNSNSNQGQRSQGDYRSQGASVRTLNAEVPQQEMLREDENQM